jgi:Phytanoyl-CoA dioxygenase (PhyH)
MLELADSNDLIGDPDALTGRLAKDGYLFFRGLLPPATVRAAGVAILGQLRAGGWSPGPGGPGAATVREALADPAFRAAITSPGLNQIPYLPPLRGLVQQLLGPQAFSYPAKVLRAVHPETQGASSGLRRHPGRSPGRPLGRPLGRYVHYDYAVSGVQDMLTSWVPLMDVPVRLGGLAVRPGGHLAAPVPPQVLSQREPGWATTGYHPGDLIVFHCLTPHAALPNTDTALRLSADFRWQRADQPAPAELVLGPAGRPRWAGTGAPPELFSRLFGGEPWWEPVPAGLTLRPRAQLAAVPPGPSRYFRVHRGWQHWRLPPGAVH